MLGRQRDRDRACHGGTRLRSRNELHAIRQLAAEGDRIAVMQLRRLLPNLDVPCDVDMAPGDSMAEVHASVGEAFDVVLKPVSHPELAEIRIDENLFAIGRAEAPFDSCAPEAVAQLSRRHARIFTEHGAVYVADLDSKNGTSVNGAEVRQKPALLRNGDTICFGSKLWYRVQFVPRATNRAQRGAPGHGDARARARRPRPATDRRRQFPFLVSKADDVFARHRAQYPHQVNYVSRRHAHVFLKGGAPFVEDLGSTNGTFVNGKRLEAARSRSRRATSSRLAARISSIACSVRCEPEVESTLTQVREAVDARRRPTATRRRSSAPRIRSSISSASISRSPPRTKSTRKRSPKPPMRRRTASAAASAAASRAVLRTAHRRSRATNALTSKRGLASSARR